MSDIRKFDDEAIQRSIDNALLLVPRGTKGVVLAVKGNDEQVRLAVMARINDNWSAVGYLAHSYAGNDLELSNRLEYGAEIRWEFGD
jgi:hypothetical protein